MLAAFIAIALFQNQDLSLQAIETLKFEALRDLQNGRFIWEIQGNVNGEESKFGVEIVNRGAQSRTRLTDENGNAIAETQTTEEGYTVVRHAMQVYGYKPRDGDSGRSSAKREWHHFEEGQNFEFRFGHQGLRLVVLEDHQTTLMGRGQETLGGVECEWYEHDVLFPDRTLKTKQWFKKGTWLLYKLEFSGRSDGGTISTSAVATVFEPDTPPTDAQLMVSPDSYEDYEKLVLTEGLDKAPVDESGLPSFDQIQLNRHSAMAALDSGRFDYAGLVKRRGQPNQSVSFRIRFVGDKEYFLQSDGGKKGLEFERMPGKWTNVYHDRQVYTEEPPPGWEPRTARGFEFEAPELDKFNAKVQPQGPFVVFNEQQNVEFFGREASTIDGVELDRYEHRAYAGINYIEVVQWFAKDTWLPYRVDVKLVEYDFITLSVQFVATTFEPDADVSENDLSIDTEGYKDLPLFGLPRLDPDRTAPDMSGTTGFHEIEEKRIQALVDMNSGKFSYLIDIQRPEDDRLLYFYESFMQGEKFRMAMSQNYTELSELAIDGESAFQVDHPSRRFRSFRPTGEYLRRNWIYAPGDVDPEEPTWRLNQKGFFIDLSGTCKPTLIGRGLETIEGKEYEWFEHRYENDAIGLQIKQWFKRGTWYRYKADVVFSYERRGGPKVSVNSFVFEPDAYVADEELKIDPKKYAGYSGG